MSIRTIIEINHDRLVALGVGGVNEDILPKLLQVLRSSGPDETQKIFFTAFGIRILGQRHHTESEDIKMECFWESGCSDKARCIKFGQCVASWQNAHKDEIARQGNTPDELSQCKEKAEALEWLWLKPTFIHYLRYYHSGSDTMPPILRKILGGRT